MQILNCRLNYTCLIWVVLTLTVTLTQTLYATKFKLAILRNQENTSQTHNVL